MSATNTNTNNSPSRLVLFVCTSNTCRSPMAEALGKEYLRRNGIGGITVSSRAICEDYEPQGSPASEQGVQVMREEYGLDTSSHRSRLLTPDDIAQATAIYGVSKSHANAILTLFPQARNKVWSLSRDVSDPWHQHVSVYKSCAAQLVPLVSEALEAARKL